MRRFSLSSLVIVLFSLLMVACSSKITSVLKKRGDSSRVHLSQVQKKKESLRTDGKKSSGIYTKQTQDVLDTGYTEYDNDDATGEKIMNVSLNEVHVIAKSRNIPERNGKITLDFRVSVPSDLINNKWQVRLTPVADKNGKQIHFDKILISGAQFLRQQQRGYNLYQDFINSIIPDSAYMARFFNEKGYQKALFSIEEGFYHAWLKDQLSHSRFVDWRNVRNRRNILFNGVMLKNRSVATPETWRNALPSHWLERKLSSFPGEWNNYLSPEYRYERKTLSQEDSIALSKKYFDYKRMVENERKKALLSEKYNEYVRFPKEPCRLDTIIQVGDRFDYYYSQPIDVDEDIRKIDVTLSGEVVAIDESTYTLPKSDTLTYFVSSMVQFLDRNTRFKRIILSRHASANVTAFINYKSGSSRFDPLIGNNKEELEKISAALHKLTFTGELVLDSVNMIATSSPEGSEQMNKQLSIQRATELKTYLLNNLPDAEEISLFQVRSIGEDWKKLERLIASDENIPSRKEILSTLSTVKNNDQKENMLRGYKDYPYIREKLYPQLRAVNFEFHLHRREMIKDTIHTTVVDTAYMDAVRMLENRQYKDALSVLQEYNDQNTAVCLMSLGYDAAALEIFSSLPKDENIYYLLAVLYVRQKRYSEAVSSFTEACRLDISKWYRGSLDPEISALINEYNLNFDLENE